MLRMFLTIACFFTGLCAAFPMLAPRIAPQPPNGTIELHHDPTTSSWYLLASLNPANYSDTYGNKTILGKQNPASIVTIFFTVKAYETLVPATTLYAIYANPVAFEHHVDDPLTAIYLYNLYDYCTPGVQCFPIFLDVNGTEPVGSGGGGDIETGESYMTGLSVDLNYPFNITGPEDVASWNGAING